MNKFLDTIALRITAAVGTMWCALAFTALSLVSLPNTLKTGEPVVIVSWVAQTFLQLVLLSVIMVGQRLQGQAAEDLQQETHDIVKAEAADLKALLADAHALLGTMHELVAALHAKADKTE